jgi:NAD(P)-dependent dehydrogenase (short-subunit alcohol dehydrogenase family)
MGKRLDGKAALVTGAGSGIGKAIALRFAQEGARVAVLDVNERRAQEAVRGIEVAGGTALALTADVGNAEAVEQAIESLRRKFSALHILVNNAGIARKKMFEQMSPEEWEKVWTTNLTGVLNCTRRSLPLLKKQGGSIVNMASVEVYSHSRKLTAYAASKGALASLSRTLAVELGPQGIRVNYICPGFIRTEMTQAYSKRWLLRKYLERQTPLGRMGEPEDVARAALFLASEDSAFMTGVGITVDGGLTLRVI